MQHHRRDLGRRRRAARGPLLGPLLDRRPRSERLAGRQLQCIGHTEDGCPAPPSQLLVNYQKLQPFTVEHFTYPPGLRGTPRAPDRPPPIA